MKYEVRAITYKRTGAAKKPLSHLPTRVRVERLLATTDNLEEAICIAAEHTATMHPEDAAWVTEQSGEGGGRYAG